MKQEPEIDHTATGLSAFLLGMQRRSQGRMNRHESRHWMSGSGDQDVRISGSSNFFLHPFALSSRFPSPPPVHCIANNPNIMPALFLRQCLL